MTFKKTAAAAAIGAAVLMMAASAQAQVAEGDWTYHGDGASDRFTPLAQITPANVGALKEAWRFPMAAGGLESQPIKVGNSVYVVTTDRKVVALDAVTGVPKWTFTADTPANQPIRGLEPWMDGDKLRLILGRDNFLYMIDAETGTLVPSFGQGGKIDARDNLRGKPEDNAIYITSPARVYQNLIIVGGRLAENSPASPGDVRAFDAKSGKLAWTFHTIPHPGEVGAETWPKDAYLTQGGANAWSGASVDVGKGVVYVNTGSPADDFYGVKHLGDNRMANSTIALDAKTGKRLWDFQQVHHDLWDSDSTNPPVLASITRNGRKVDVVVATNKAYYVYILDRATGKPIYPMVETPFLPSNVPGEVASKTQPIPSLPKALVPKTITVDMLNNSSPQINAAARAAFSKLYGQGRPFTPLGLNQDTLVIPGFSGQIGGMATDRKGVLYVGGLTGGAGMSKIVDNTKIRETIGEPGAPTPFGGAQNGYQRLYYGFSGYGSFRIPDPAGAAAAGSGSPPMISGLAPTVATFNAIDMNTGQYRWTVQVPGRNAGAGPLVTATGLVFVVIGNRLTALSTEDGSKISETVLPGAGGASPGAYLAAGKEYIMLASGGPNAAYVAYTLP